MSLPEDRPTPAPPAASGLKDELIAGLFGYDVFISHTGDGLPYARELARQLAAEKKRCFLDQAGGLGKGDLLHKKVAAALSKSAVLVVVATEVARTAPWTLGEARFYRQQRPNDPVIPIAFHDPPDRVPWKQVNHDLFRAAIPHVELTPGWLGRLRTGMLAAWDRLRNVAVDRPPGVAVEYIGPGGPPGRLRSGGPAPEVQYVGLGDAPGPPVGVSQAATSAPEGQPIGSGRLLAHLQSWWPASGADVIGLGEAPGPWVGVSQAVATSVPEVGSIDIGVRSDHLVGVYQTAATTTPEEEYIGIGDTPEHLRAGQPAPEVVSLVVASQRRTGVAKRARLALLATCGLIAVLAGVTLNSRRVIRQQRPIVRTEAARDALRGLGFEVHDAQGRDFRVIWDQKPLPPEKWQQAAGPLRTLDTDANLASIELLYCGVADLRPLSGLTSVRTLKVAGSSGLIDLSPAAGLRDLRQLDLMSCPGLRDASLAVCQDFPHLTGLIVSDCAQITADGLKPLAGLPIRSLILSFDPLVANAGLDALAGLPELREVMLDQTGVRIDDDLVDLILGLPRLESVNLAGLEVEDDQLRRLREQAPRGLRIDPQPRPPGPKFDFSADPARPPGPPARRPDVPSSARTPPGDPRMLRRRTLLLAGLLGLCPLVATPTAFGQAPTTRVKINNSLDEFVRLKRIGPADNDQAQADLDPRGSLSFDEIPFRGDQVFLAWGSNGRFLGTATVKPSTAGQFNIIMTVAEGSLSIAVTPKGR